MNKPKKAAEHLAIARLVQRPTTLELINYIFDDFIELHGDRNYRDDKAIVGGVCLLDGRPVTVIGTQKGHKTDENIRRNFGQPHPEGYRKTLRLMKQAEKFHRPVICFVNTSGAYSGAPAEERGQGEAIARNLIEMSSLKTPIISIICGEGGSGGALALAVADRVWALENAVYSILTPEGFASILWKDSSRSAEAADVMKITSFDLYKLGIIEKIIDEVEGGLQNDLKYSADILKKELIDTLDILGSKSYDGLIDERYARFRKIGVFSEISDLEEI